MVVLDDVKPTTLGREGSYRGRQLIRITGKDRFCPVEITLITRSLGGTGPTLKDSRFSSDSKNGLERKERKVFTVRT